MINNKNVLKIEEENVCLCSISSSTTKSHKDSESGEGRKTKLQGLSGKSSTFFNKVHIIRNKKYNIHIHNFALTVNVTGK